MPPESNSQFRQPHRNAGPIGFGSRLNRRRVLSLMSASLIGGCGSQKENASEPLASTARQQVPLRILLVGNEAAAEAIRLAWSMTQEQTLDIQVLEPNDLKANDTVSADASSEPSDSTLVRRVTQVDVAIVPQDALGVLTDADAVVPISDQVSEKLREEYGKPFPAVSNGLGTYGGQQWGVAAGAKVFAILALDSEVQCDTWADYHDWIGELDGKAAEPLAEGWRATSFLNRCATTIDLGWLFSRQNMKPEIDGPQYVSVLSQLAETAKSYESKPMTPAQIWRAIKRGQLRGGIGYEVPESLIAAEPAADQPDTDNVDDFEVGVFDCPRETETDRLWFGQQTPLACISVGCRQTDASRQFLGWLSGGERIHSVRQKTTQFSPTRETRREDRSSITSGYSRWLTGRLQTRQVVPSLIIPGAELYYEALEQSIARCLAGDHSPQAALTEAAGQWESITEQLGRKQQTVAWKKTLGFGA